MIEKAPSKQTKYLNNYKDLKGLFQLTIIK